MSTVATRKLTAEEYFDLPDPPDGSKQELVRGEVVTMPNPGWEHGEVQVNVATAIKLFLKQHPIGRVAVESGVITERDDDTVRGPDVSFYSQERLPLGKRVVKYHDQPADLCVEVVSPSNSMKKLKAKAKEYLFAGVRLVWIVDPEDRTVSVIADPLEARVLEADAPLDGGDVLPGFSCKVADLFA
ncbi:MAG: Uma2 family endonuclease [Gemmataceae bacterium]|nr:Uma2 family endonuclease [Gemmataceae bacterium]